MLRRPFHGLINLKLALLLKGFLIFKGRRAVPEIPREGLVVLEDWADDGATTITPVVLCSGRAAREHRLSLLPDHFHGPGNSTTA